MAQSIWGRRWRRAIVPAVRVLIAIPSLALILLMLGEFFLSFLSPQRVRREPRVARWLIVRSWRIWRAIAKRFGGDDRETWLGFFGPLGLLIQLAVWISGLIVGFMGLHYAFNSELASGGTGFGDYLYYSAGSFFSAATNLHAASGADRVIEIAEAVCGYLVLFGAIGYLPALFQAYSRREVAVSQLDPRAGSPPSSGTLLFRAAKRGGWGELDSYLADWENWAAELMETHLSYPLLAFYRSQHVNQNWLSALVTVLDASAFAIAVAPERTPAAEVTFAIGRHALADLAHTFRAPPREPEHDRLERGGLRAAAPEAGRSGGGGCGSRVASQARRSHRPLRALCRGALTGARAAAAGVGSRGAHRELADHRLADPRRAGPALAGRVAVRWTGSRGGSGPR